MSTRKKTKPEEASANAKFNVTITKPKDITDSTTKTANFMKQNPAYATTPAIQDAVGRWETSAAAVRQNDHDIKSTRVSLAALLGARRTTVADWKRETKGVLAVVNQVAKGSANAVKEWGFDVTARVVAPAMNDAPTGLRVVHDKALDLVVRWKAVRGHRGYVLQMGDGTPNGWGPSIQVAQSRFKPTGLTPGQHVSFRVQVQRKNGLSAWSDVLSVTAR